MAFKVKLKQVTGKKDAEANLGLISKVHLTDSACPVQPKQFFIN